MPNSIFFSQEGAKNSKFAADYESENLKYKTECAMYKFQKTRSKER